MIFRNAHRGKQPRAVAMAAGALLATSLIAGCSSDGSSIRIGDAEIRIIHTSPDAPAVNASLDGGVSNAVTNLDYATSTGYIEVDATSYDIVVEGIGPGMTTIPNVIVVNGFALADGERQTVLAVNPVASIAPLVVADSVAEPAAGEVAIRVVHASPAADGATATVDVYVTAPGAPLTGAATLALAGDVDLGAVPVGNYQVRITLPGTSTILYDSGTIDLTPFAGQKLLIAAIDTINDTQKDGTNGALVKLLVATDASTADSGTVEILDESTQAGAKVLHASPDAAIAAGGPVEVFANMAVELIPSFNYLDTVPGVDSYVGVAAGDYVFDVAPDGAGVGGSVFTSGTIPLAAGEEYTVIAAGDVVSGTPAFTLLATQDDNRSIATQVGVKVVHGAAAVGNVNVHVTTAGTCSQMDVIMETMGCEALLPNFAFGTISDLVAVAAGSYDVRVVAGGAVAIEALAFPLSAGTVATVVAVGPDEDDNDPAAAGLVVLTN